MRSGWVMLGALLVGAATASAEGDCRDIEDDAERLACYDQLLAPADARQVAEPPSAPEAEAGDQATATTQASDESAGAQRRSLFGRVLGGIKLPKPKPKNVVASGKIVRVRELARGNFELELEDGQVWRENERELRTNYRVGDMVVVSSGMLGTFNLDNERSGQRTKARRVR